MVSRGYVMNIGRDYVLNVGRGYVIQNSESVSEWVTKVGIELLGQLKKHILLHPQLDPILKFYCYFNALVLPNMMRWTWFDLLIISGVKFWWFSFFYFLERTSGSRDMPNLRLVKNWEICSKIVIIIIGIMQYTVVHWTSLSFLAYLKLGITRLLEVRLRK